MKEKLHPWRIAPTKAAAATWFGISLPAFDGWLRRGCPTLEGRGPRGELRVDLLEAAQWRYGVEAGEAGRLDPSREKAALDAARRAEIEQRLAVKNRELIPSAEYAQAFTGVCKQIALHYEAMPDDMERRGLLPPAAMDAFIAAMDSQRELLYARIIAIADEMGRKS